MLSKWLDNFKDLFFYPTHLSKKPKRERERERETIYFWSNFFFFFRRQWRRRRYLRNNFRPRRLSFRQSAGKQSSQGGKLKQKKMAGCLAVVWIVLVGVGVVVGFPTGRGNLESLTRTRRGVYANSQNKGPLIVITKIVFCRTFEFVFLIDFFRNSKLYLRCFYNGCFYNLFCYFISNSKQFRKQVGSQRLPARDRLSKLKPSFGVEIWERARERAIY